MLITPLTLGKPLREREAVIETVDDTVGITFVGLDVGELVRNTVMDMADGLCDTVDEIDVVMVPDRTCDDVTEGDSDFMVALGCTDEDVDGERDKGGERVAAVDAEVLGDHVCVIDGLADGAALAAGTATP